MWGDDYYIATSTFEWFPGVQIHHSRDLVHWRLIGQSLTRRSQLDMRGNPNSGGIWAPCLTYADGLFWLIYTDVKSFNGIFKDTHNYLVTAPDITGPWSEPIYLNASGFDPSLLHDTDGRKWLVNQIWDHRAGRNRFGGILLLDGQTYIPFGPPLDGLMMSDDSTGVMSFTGTMVALACQDMGGTHLTADFDFLDYVEDRTLGWM